MPLIDLLPCPFCGGAAKYEMAYGVRCLSCGAHVPCKGDDFTPWNTRALPTVQPEPAPALGAEWMRREAEKAILALWQWDDEGWQTHRPNNSEARAAILAIPGPTHEQLLADALAMPEVKALVDALEKLARLGNGELYGSSDGNMIARAVLAKFKGYDEAEEAFGYDYARTIGAALAKLKGGA